MSDRYKAYLICKQRGHTSDGTILASIPPKCQCKFCGTIFWHEWIARESNVPEPPEGDEA